MKNYLIVICILTVLFSTSCKKVNSNKSLDNKVAEKWTSLFNGKDLNNWIVKIKGYPLNENINNTFRVENGVIKVSYDGYENFNETYGHLFYKTSFSNYRLRLQYRFTGNQIKGGAGWAERNSGVMIHSQSPESMELNQSFPLSIEVQMLGGIDKDIERPTGNLCTPGTHVVFNNELLTQHCINSNSKTFYGEQWVDLEIIVDGNSITHKINKETVLSYSKPQIGGDLDGLAEEWKVKEGEFLMEGYISLQSESHPVEFRNIEILEL